jgi:hypothetical protein
MPPKKNNLDNSKSNEMFNFYTHKKVKELLTQYENPHFDDHQISIPFRMGIVSASGGGKTVFALNLISKMQNTWGHIYVVYKASEPLYEFMSKQIGEKNITFFTNIAKFPTLNEIPRDKQVLCIFDDCVTLPEKAQEIIKEISVRGRKHGKGVSLLYLTQSFYKVPRLIRLQFNYLILLKLGSRRDMEMILNECSLGIEKDELLKLYKDATKEKFNFLKINLDSSNENEKFSHNFNSFYKIESETDSDESI